MSQYVIEFGAAELQSIGKAIETCLAMPYGIFVDGIDKKRCYARAATALDEVLKDLAAGTALSVTIRNNDHRIRYGLITSPQTHVPQLSLWMGTIEVGVEDWAFVWDLLLTQSELRFVCVGSEEGVELSDEQISVETFPWAEWPLLIGAVRSDKGSEWIVRARVPAP